jgi:hypothetical protein
MRLGSYYKENREYQRPIYSYTVKYVSPRTNDVTNNIDVARSV